MYRDPGAGPISFGDIFEAEHLIDIHGRADTRALGGGNTPRTTAEKVANAESKTLAPGDPVAIYSPSLPPRLHSHHVLGFGTTMKLDARTRALLISDSCATDTALGRDREQRRADGRLLFAPIVPATAKQIERLQESPVFGRFPLDKIAAEDAAYGAIAELRCCFMLDARDVDATPRILSLTDDAAEDLEAAWDAYALRRGPQAVEHNAGKLARRLSRDGETQAIEDAMDSLERTLETAWRLEGGALRELAAAERGDDRVTREEVAGLVEAIAELERRAREARERVEALGDGSEQGGLLPESPA